MSGPREEFLSEEDLDLVNLTEAELFAWWNLWLSLAQASNEEDEACYSHGVFREDPAVLRRRERPAAFPQGTPERPSP